MTMYDVIRYLIRNQGHANGGVEQDLLLTVDGTESGYPDLESYKEALADKARQDAAQAAAQAAGPRAPADTTSALSDEQLRAELVRREALSAAAAPRPTPPPAAPPAPPTAAELAPVAPAPPSFLPAAPASTPE